MIRQPLTSRWKEILALGNRRAPDLFEPDDVVEGTPYADEIKKAFRELDVSAMFCVQGVPTVAIINQPDYDSDEIVRVHAALWNQGLASVLIIITEDTVRVFSLAKAPGAADDSQFEDRCLIEALDAGAATLNLSGYISGAESGRLWNERSDYFNSKERIDYVLLNNLTVAHDLLVRDTLSPTEAQAILIQTMFIAYLEDRKITGSDYFESATSGESTDLRGLLSNGNVDNLEHLFKQLHRDFNGDLFVAPCSFDTDDKPHRLNAFCMEILQRFRDGREEMSATSSQMRFWGYDFRYIPVELISAVYDRFLGEDDEARRDAGAYYTPMFLVDTVISSVWENLTEKVKSHGKFLDPACGSGIFLVRSFQRMCEHWRANSKQKTIRWDSLLKMLDRVHGRDLNGGAVRVAVFSLYIALLEEVSPPDIRKLVSKGRVLPPLWNKTIVQRDFFDEEPDNLMVDVVIGNPPWTSRRNSSSSGKTWGKSKGVPIPSREEAWAFTWKSREHLKSGGITAYLLPAMGFLHNHAALAVTARVRLFQETKVIRVINFADLRRQLFDIAKSPTALILFTRTEDSIGDYKFQHWAPKADLNLSIKRFISLSSLDKSKIKASDVEKNPLIFKQHLWMQPTDAKLFSYLSRMPRLRDVVQPFGTLKKKNISTDHGWVIGQGFKPFHGGADGTSSAQNYKSDTVSKYKYLPIESYTPVAISSRGLKKWHSSKVHRVGFERGFTGPRILIPRGVQTKTMRLRAAFVDKPLTFQGILLAIAVAKGEEKQAKLITAILNSRLAIWYAFHGTASLGSARPEVPQGELLRLPMPAPTDLANQRRSILARDQLVNIVDKAIDQADDILRSPSDLDKMLRNIDIATYDYFCLSEEEITIVEDTVTYILPAVQPNNGTFPEIWKQTSISQRKTYAQALQKNLRQWFGDGTGISISLISKNSDFALIKLQLIEVSDNNTYSEVQGQNFQQSLEKLSAAVNRPVECNFQTIPDMRVFVGDSLYLIKPLQLRFWLESSALADAESIASDLQTLVETERKRGFVS